MLHWVYDSRNKSTSNLEPLQHSDANGIIVHPSKLLIIAHDFYTLRKALIAIIAIVQCFKIPLSVVHRVYDSRKKSTSNLETLQHSDANGIIVHPSKLLIIVHDFYTLRKALIAIIATVQLLKFQCEWYSGCTTPESNSQVIWSLCNILMQMASLYTLPSY